MEDYYLMDELVPGIFILSRYSRFRHRYFKQYLLPEKVLSFVENTKCLHLPNRDAINND